MTFDQWRDTTPVPIGADGALALLVAAVEAETDPSWECNSYHPSLWPALKAARTALASAAQRDLLRDFARAVMQAWPEGGIDGGELQDIALAHGLLRPAEPPTDWDGCNFYERTELIK